VFAESYVKTRPKSESGKTPIVAIGEKKSARLAVAAGATGPHAVDAAFGAENPGAGAVPRTASRGAIA
jgi:hypothetical protein